MSKASKSGQSRIRSRKITPYDRGLLIVVAASLALYVYVLSQFPPFISDIVIYSIASVLLNVEGFLLALSVQIRQAQRRFVVGVGLIAILLSVVTIAKAYFESVQLKYLSYAPTTDIFDSDVVLFGMFVGVYAVSLLLPAGEKKREISAGADESTSPEETEP